MEGKAVLRGPLNSILSEFWTKDLVGPSIFFGISVISFGFGDERTKH